MFGTLYTLHHVHPMRPEIAGRCFSDTHGLSDQQINALAAQGLVFLTEFEQRTRDGRRAIYGGEIVARSWRAAERIAARRGFGEEVVGQLKERGDA